MRIVTALHLESWADTLTAKQELPGVVASLIRASCPTLQSYRFPTGDASQTHGFDGVAEVIEGNVFVPVGRSIWEFGAGEDYKTKASDDYEKRTEQLTSEERSKQSFFFVTPRRWDTGLGKWQEGRSGDGWVKVRIIDSGVLEQWLGDYPAVALPLARELSVI